MSESTRTTADGGTSDTLNVEDLFATDDTDISIDDGESDDRTTTASTESTTPGAGTATPDAEDTTADELFAQLRDEHDDAEQAHAVDDVTDESPEDIMARADEDAEHVDQIDDSIRADEGALDDLLLTERREADGFLWVETESDDATGDASDDVAALFEGDDADDEQAAEREQAAEAEQGGADDDFSLADGVDDSFEARAATFDADEFGVDATAFDDDADASENDDADASENDDADASDDAIVDDDAQTAKDDAVAGDDAEDGNEDGTDGLAARIRSILTG